MKSNDTEALNTHQKWDH